MNDPVYIFSDGATIGKNGKLGSVSEVGLGIYFPTLNYGDSKKVKGISNNEAEFKALIWAMEVAIDKGIKNAIFCLDSRIVVNRANGKKPYKKKYYNERMDNFQNMVLELAKKFYGIQFMWVSREENTVADYYSKLA